MNDIIPAKNYSLYKHRFYAIQKIRYKNLYLIQINKNEFKNTVRSFHIRYYYTLTFKNKQKNDTISINGQQ